MSKIFLIQLVERLRTSKPAFFAKLQTYAIILIVALGAVETLAAMDVIHLSEKVTLLIGAVIAFLAGNVVVAQMPVKDPNQK